MLPAKLSERQAVSLARRMAGKKGAVVQLQAEINTQDDWEKLLTRDGLIVVDVYSDWCGPCVGMVGNLKKCKLEIGGDLLHLAIAKADEIEVLKRFRNRSEPSWMFISSGKLLNVMIGSNAPKLMQLIETELKILQKGTYDPNRVTYKFDELTPEEEERAAALEKQRAQEEAEAAAIELLQRNEDRDKLYGQMVPHLLTETVAICLPHTVRSEGAVFHQQIEYIWGEIGVSIAEFVRTEITPETWEEITYRERGELTDDLKACLALNPCLALLVRCNLSPPPGVTVPETPGDVEKLIWESLNLNKIQSDEIPVPHPESIPAKHHWKKEVVIEIEKKDGKESVTDDVVEQKRLSKKDSIAPGTDAPGPEFVITNVPGIFTFISPLSKCAAIVKLFPARAAKISVTEVQTLPPRMALVFEPDKGEECFTLAQEIPNEVLGIGYFSKGDPDDGKLIAKSQRQFETLEHNEDNRLVVVVAKRLSEHMLSFVALGPVYISPDEKVGAIESDKFFPPGVDLDVDDEDDAFDDFDDEEESGSEEEHSSEGENSPATTTTTRSSIKMQ